MAHFMMRKMFLMSEKKNRQTLMYLTFPKPTPVLLNAADVTIVKERLCTDVRFLNQRYWVCITLPD